MGEKGRRGKDGEEVGEVLAVSLRGTRDPSPRLKLAPRCRSKGRPPDFRCEALVEGYSAGCVRGCVLIFTDSR